MDCARTIKRLGAKEVTILYRRDDNMRIRHFSDAMRYGNVKYKEISIYWKMLEIYKYL